MMGDREGDGKILKARISSEQREEYSQRAEHKRHVEEARLFLKSLGAVSKAPPAELQKAVSSAVITFAEAALMCGTDARELWRDHISHAPGFVIGREGLRFYNGDEPGAEFVNQTLSLLDVVELHCRMERSRRSSYQEVVRFILSKMHQDEGDLRQAEAAHSTYLDLPPDKAIAFESAATVLAGYLRLHPIEQGADVDHKARYLGANEERKTLIDTNADLAATVKALTEIWKRQAAPTPDQADLTSTSPAAPNVSPQQQVPAILTGWASIEEKTGMSRMTLSRAQKAARKQKPVIHQEGNKVWAKEDELLALRAWYGQHKARQMKKKKSSGNNPK